MADLGTAYLRVMPDTSGLNARMAAYFSSSQWKAMGATAGVALGAGLAAGGVVKGLYEIGQAFDDAYDKMRTQTGATGKAMKGLERDFKNVVSSVPADFGDAAAAVGGLSQRLDEQGAPLRKLSKQLLELSRITDTDVSTNVSTVTRLFGDWSVKTKDQTDTLNKLYRASEATGIQVSDLADLMVQFGSPLRQLGLDFDTAAAMFSRFEKEGVNIQTLMPGLRMALKNFSAGSPDFIASMDKLGVSLKDGPAAALAEVMEAIKDAPTTLKANQTAFEVFGARAGPDMAAAIREGRFELKDLMAEIEGGKDTIRKAGRQTMDFGEQWKVLKNYLAVKLEPVASRVFGSIGDEMKKLVNILTDDTLTSDEKITKFVGELSTKISEAAPKMVQAGEALGVAIVKGMWEGSKHALLEGTARIGELAVNQMIGQIDAGIETINKLWDEANPFGNLGPLSVDAPNIPTIDTVAFSQYQKVIDSGVPEIANHFLDLNKRVADLITTQKNLHEASKPLDKDLGTLSSGLSKQGTAALKTQVDMDKWARNFKDSMRDATKAGREQSKDFDKDQDDVGKAADRGGKKIDDYSKDAADSFGWLTGKSGKMAKGVSGNNASMVNAVGTGLGTLVDNVNKALQSFQVKKVAYSVKKVGKDVGNIVGAQKGAIVPGTGSGDKVPLHLDGQLAAMVEPGELVSVANRNATNALMQANKDVPRFKGGGVVGGVNAMMALANKFDRASEPYSLGGGHGGFLTSPAPVDCSGAVSAILHAGGLLQGAPMDTVALANWGKPAQGNENLVVATRPITGAGGHTVMEINGRVFGTSGENPAGGAGWLSSSNPRDYVSGAVLRTMDIGAAVGAIARVMLQGPDGPLKGMGQAGLDKVRKAGNAFVQSKMPMGSFGGGDAGGADIANLPKSLAKYNHQWPHDSSDSIGSGPVKAMTAWQGLPSWFWKIAIGESNFEPGAVSFDGGYGLFQETAPYANPYVKAVTGKLDYEAMLNPILNTMAARKHFDGAASQVPNTLGFPWYGTNGLQRGGIVPHLKGGSKGHSIDFHTASGLGVPITEAQKIAHRLKKLTSERGKIAKLDERISIADTLANADGTLTDAEIAREVALNKQLLEDLKAANRLSGAGYRIARHGLHGAKGSTRERLRSLMQGFRSTQTDMSGVTGKGGRIFDTRQTIAGLLGTDTSPTGMDISGLRSVIEAAQYGAFANLPKFHQGGTVPGPPSREVPIMARGGETVSNGGVTVNNNFSFDEFGMLIETEVNGVLVQRERKRYQRSNQRGKLRV